MTYDLRGKRVFVAGHNGMVGRALVNRLQSENCEILTATRAELDLTRQAEVEAWFAKNKPQAVIMAAAKVGGIVANSTYPADFLIQNLLIEINTITAAFKVNIEKFLLLGSSCIYPKFAPQPIAENSLLTSALEPTNESYAIAKIAGVKMCEALQQQHKAQFISAMPCNLYGAHDNYDLQNSHVIPALIRKIHEAKVAAAPTVTLWGTGTPLREFLFAEDAADGLVYILKHYEGRETINLGAGSDITIADLARLIADIIGYSGGFVFDATKPDGTPRKLLDSGKLRALGWQPRIPLAMGLKLIYNDFLSMQKA
jgi:GDP-L-fucose synthase